VLAEGADRSTPVGGGCLSGELITIRAHETLEQAMDLMARHQLRRLPVVADADELVGMVSQADIARMASDRDTGDVVAAISETTPTSAFDQSYGWTARTAEKILQPAIQGGSKKQDDVTGGVVKVIELVGSSPQSFSDAVRNAVRSRHARSDTSQAWKCSINSRGGRKRRTRELQGAVQDRLRRRGLDR
jgi:hypothetical protein